MSLKEEDKSNIEDLDSDLEDEDVSQESFEHHRFVADPGQSPLRVDKFLVNRIENATRNKIQEAATKGCVLVNGVAVKSNYKVKPDDVITIEMSYPPREIKIIAEDIPLDIVYEDDDIIIINKQAGMVVHPGHGNYTGTLVNALAWHFKGQPWFNSDDPRPGLVHRIDKDTTGLLVVAKNEESKVHLAKQFFDKTSKRTYQAIVWGRIEEKEGTITGNIGRSLQDRKQMAVFPDGDQGKPAVTHYKVIEELGYVSLVECQLETGRTHQIRTHLKYIGNTLFNDERYGGNRVLKGSNFSKYTQFITNCFKILPRQALHAKTLGFIHPKTEKYIEFETDLPDDMQTVIERWRRYIAAGEDEVLRNI